MYQLQKKQTTNILTSKGETKMSLRNKRDFREAVLQALDVTDDKDVENEYNFKSAVLEAMGVEFVPADLRDFEIYRAKLVEGIGNMSSGGGGSSDFSTAEVTIINNRSDMGINFLMPTFMETPFISSTYLSEPIFAHRTVVAPVILYKNKGGIAVRDYDTYETKPNFAVTGSIEYIGDGEFDITGDGTITIS